MRYTCFFISILLLVGCKDFLEPGSESEYTPRDVSTLNELLLGEAYIGVDKSGGHWGSLGIISLFDDDIHCRPLLYPEAYTVENWKINDLFWIYTWQPDYSLNIPFSNVAGQRNITDKHLNIYKEYFVLINGANAALDYVDKVAGTNREKNIVRAQAYTLRAFYYFTLVNIYGAPYNHNKEALGVPLVLTSSYNPNPIIRSTVSQVYEQIIQDLLMAKDVYEQLPPSDQWKKDMRTSLPMVELLLSRVFLYMEDWENAEKYAKKLLDDWKDVFPLLSLAPLSNTYDFINPNNPEAIFTYGTAISDFDYMQMADLTYVNFGPPLVYGTWKIFNASESLMNSFEPGDLRKDKYIRSVKENDTTLYLAYGKISLGAGSFGRTLRIAEGYLNYAEALAHTNQLQKSLDIINYLRTFRFSSASDINLTDVGGQSGLIDFIKEERRRELCFEFHRWFDLRRYGMPTITRVWNDVNGSREYTLKQKDLFYTLGLPIQALQGNPNLINNPLPPTRLPNNK